MTLYELELHLAEGKQDLDWGNWLMGYFNGLGEVILALHKVSRETTDLVFMLAPCRRNKDKLHDKIQAQIFISGFDYQLRGIALHN